MLTRDSFIAGLILEGATVARDGEEGFESLFVEIAIRILC